MAGISKYLLVKANPEKNIPLHRGAIITAFTQGPLPRQEQIDYWKNYLMEEGDVLVLLEVVKMWRSKPVPDLVEEEPDFYC